MRHRPFKFLSSLACRILSRSASARRSGRRSVRLSLEWLEERLAPATVTWINSGGGSWNNAANWSTGAVPGVNDDVVINGSPGAFTVTVGSGNYSVHSITSQEAISLSGGTLSIASTSQIDTLTIGSNSVLGGAGNVTINSNLTWNGGAVQGTGTLTVASGASATLSGTDTLTNGKLSNAGSMTWAAGLILNQSSSSVFDNASGGSLTLQGNATVADTTAYIGVLYYSDGYPVYGRVYSGAVPTFSNEGTVSNSTGNLSVGVSFSNAGTVNSAGGTVTLSNASSSSAHGVTVSVSSSNSNSGTLNINGGSLAITGAGSDSGSIVLASGVALTIANTYTFTSTSSLSGSGSATFSAGTITESGSFNLGGSLTVSGGMSTFNGTSAVGIGGSLTVSGGTANFNASASVATLPSSIVISGGTANFNASGSMTNLTLGSGTLGGSGVMTVTGSLSWTGGTMTGSGSTVISAGANATLSGTLSLSSRTFSNAGSMTWADGLILNQANSSVFDNTSGGTLTLQGNATVADTTAYIGVLYYSDGYPVYGRVYSGAAPILSNEGTVSKGSTGNISVGVSFSNAGTVNSAGGAVTLSNASSSTAHGVTVSVSSSNSNSGTLNINGGSLTITGVGSDSGSIVLASGVPLTIANTYTFTSTSSLSGSGSATFSAGTITESGSFNLGGSLTISGGTSTFNGTSTVSMSGGLTVSGGTANFNASASVATLPSSIVISGGTANFNASGSMTNLTLSSGTLSGSGVMTVTTSLSWTGGTMAGSGSTVISAGANATLSGTVGLNSRTFRNTGSMTWGNGFTLDESYSSVFDNASGGTLTLQGNATVADTTAYIGVLYYSDGYPVYGRVYSGAAPTLSNEGTVFKGSTGNISVGVSFSNAGTVNSAGGTVTLSNASSSTAHGVTVSVSSSNSNSGTLNINGGALTITGVGSDSGSIVLASGVPLTISNTYTFTSTSSLSGSGSATFSAGTITESGSFNLGGSLTISGGTSTFNGTSAVGMSSGLTVSGGTANFNTAASVATLPNSVVISGGTANFNASASMTNLTFSSGTLGGSGAITVTGGLSWTGGTMTGSGSTVISAGVNATLSGTLSLSSRTFSNAGSVTWTAGLVLNQANSSVFDNASGGTLTLQGNATVADTTAYIGVLYYSDGYPVYGRVYSGAAPTLSNEGTVFKGSTGNLSVGVSFSNAGTVNSAGGTVTLSNASSSTAHGVTVSVSSSNSNSGTLNINGGSLVIAGVGSNTGSIAVAASSQVTFSNNYTLAANSSLSGTGKVAVTAGTLTNSSGTNPHLLDVIGPSAAYVSGGINLKGSGLAVSGTEIGVQCNGASFNNTAGATYTYGNLNADGSITTLGNFNPNVGAWMAENLQPNTPYHLVLIETDPNGNQMMLDLGSTINTLNLPDMSGLYQVSVTFDSNGAPYVPSSGTINTAPTFAGSAAGAFLMNAYNLPTDGSTLPLPGLNEIAHFYQVVEQNGTSFLTTNPNFYYAQSSNDRINPLTVNVTRIGGPFAGPPNGESTDPIRYFDGAVDYSTTDLTSNGLGSPFSQTRSWIQDSQWAAGQHNGSGWIDSSTPTLLQINGTDSVSIVHDAMDIETFSLVNGQYVPNSYIPDTLVDTNGEFILTDTNGNQIHFYDFSPSTPAGRQGQFKSMTDAGGLLTYVASWTSSGAIQEIRRQDANGHDVESWLYSYLPSTDPNAGLLSSVQLRQASGSGWTVVQQVVYSYYDGVVPFGNLGDLKTATVEDGSGNVLNTTYYRYYTLGDPNGYMHGLKYVFDLDSYTRLAAAVGNPFTASDSQVAPFAHHYFQYNGLRQATLHAVQGYGNNATGGIGTFTYSYASNFANPLGINSWQYKTVETLPNGNQHIVYANSVGEVMLKVFVDLNDPGNPAQVGQTSEIYWKYGSQGRIIEEASPSAVTGYSESSPDLGVNLNSTSGLIYLTDYYTTTTATATSAGGVASYEEDTKIQQGQQGTPILQESWQYFTRTVNGATIDPLASDTVYRNSDGSGAETTSYSYTWFANSVQMQSETVNAPVISAAQNGPGTADATTYVYNIYGQQIWTRDPDGFLTYTQYDMPTGAVVESISDVNTAITSDFTNLPTGWSTPAGGGLNLVTTYQVDALGRVIETTNPNGDVTYVVYDDADQEVRIYQGWNTATGLPTGPTEVIRDDQADGYVETLTMSATPHLTNGRPDGTEAISGLQTLSRMLVNSAGQIVEEDDYFNLSGLSYSTTPHLGTAGVNYYATLYGYASDGEQDRVVNPTGTIDRTVYDGYDRVASTWVGTNDTPTSGSWSPQNNTGSSNMVEVSSFQYDNGGVGDDNLTEETDYPGGGAAPRVTEYWYDSRDRLVATKSGVQSNENDGTNRPIVFLTYDNLNEVTQTQQYDGDGVTLSTVNGQPQAPAASLLRAEEVDHYDDQGQLYQTQVYDVNPTTGAVSSTALTTNYYYDLRGNLIAESDPGGLWTKSQYDGAGRDVMDSTTDGGGGTSWAAADSVANDTVLEQVQTVYDADSNPIETIDSQRFHNATGLGALGTPTGGIGARVYYTADYYDNADRLTSSVDVGTNGGTAWTRPNTPPTPSNTALVTNYAYNAAGWVQDVTDPSGIDNRTLYDNLGRVTKTIQDYTDGTVTAESNATTEYSYDGDNNLLSVQVNEPGGAYQKTAYVYGVTTANGSDINSNDILSAVQHPDPSTGNPSSSQQDSYRVDALGETIQATDRNGNVHQYTYDVLGRLTSDAVTTLGAGVDGSVRRIDYAYDSQGNNYRVTSYDAASGGNIVNQVQQTYNGLGQLTGEYQSHSGAVNPSSTPEVQYAYTEMSGGQNNSRLTSMTYPSGYVLNYNYNTGLDSNISRLSSISDSANTLESYKYLGLDTVVERDHPQNNVNLSYIAQPGDTQANNDGGDQYTGLDRFGRVIDQNWVNSSTGTSTDRFQYGYDHDSNVLYQQNLVDAALSNLYAYDNLNQLTSFQRGTLNATHNGLVGSASHSQSWSPDALGNFTSVTTDGSTQTRTTNQQNEITSISGAGTVSYDGNGNVTADGSGNTYVYDAWNRLVAVKNGSTTLASYSYDGLGRRITETHGSTATDLYYSSADQVLEEAVGGVTQARNVWSPVAVDTLVLRDQSSQGNGVLDQRLYVQQDANGNVTALVDTSGNVVERYVYDPYGAVTVLNPDGSVRGTSNYGWMYFFQGKRYDSTVGLYDSRGRVYSPTLMRPLQADPLGLGPDTNDYRWEGNDPTSVTDPSGDAPGFWENLYYGVKNEARMWGVGLWNNPGDIIGSGFQGANYGSAVMLNELSFGQMPGAQAYINKNQADYGELTTAISAGAGRVAREALIAAGTAGLGSVVQAGRAAGYSVWTVRSARTVLAGLTLREGYQSYRSGVATWKSYQAGDPLGVLTNGAGTVLSGLGAIAGTRSLLKAPMTPKVCFPAGTPVHTSVGLKAIEQVSPGERVWSYDHQRLCWVEREVVEVYQHQHKGPMATLEVKGETLRATGGHPFWVVRGEGLSDRPSPMRIDAYEVGSRQEGRWVLARDLRAGDEVLLRAGEVVALVSVRLDEVEERVYNFHVAGLQNYAVGVCGVLVHNTNDLPAASGGSQVVQVTSWAERGITPDLNPGRWVQMGGPTWWNYIKTGLWGGRFGWTDNFPWIWRPGNTPFSNYITGFIEQSNLMWPPGWEWLKGVLGQRVIR